MKHQSHALSFDFYGPVDLRGFIDGLLLGVIAAFCGRFLGHAKTIVTADDKSYFASTTGLPPIVEWKPPPVEQVQSGSARVVWIYIPGDSSAPATEEINRVFADSAQKYGVTAKNVILRQTTGPRSGC